MHRLKWFLVIGGASLILSFPPPSQAEFKVGKVIKVGKADWAPFLGPLRWSPKGDRIAFWSGNELRLADTTGAVVYSKAFETPPRLYEWIDDSVICIGQSWFVQSGKQDKAIVTLNLKTNAMRTLAEETRSIAAAGNPNHTYIDGPYVSLEGNVYYDRWTEKRNPASRSNALNRIRPVLSANGESFVGSDHLVKWDSGGIAIISLDDKDTLRLGKPGSKEFSYHLALGIGHRFLVKNNVVLDREAQKFIDLRSLGIPKLNGGFVCGSLFHTFATSHPEVAFYWSCDDGHKVLGEQVFLLDIESSRWLNLGEQLGTSSSSVPQFSPDDMWIALLGDSDLLIVRRGDEQ